MSLILFLYSFISFSLEVVLPEASYNVSALSDQDYQYGVLENLERFQYGDELVIVDGENKIRVEQVRVGDYYVEVDDAKGDLYRFPVDRTLQTHQYIEDQRYLMQNKGIPFMTYSYDKKTRVEHLPAQYRTSPSKNLKSLLKGYWQAKDYHPEELQELLKGLSHYEQIPGFSLDKIVWTQTGWVVEGLDNVKGDLVRRGLPSQETPVMKEIKKLAQELGVENDVMDIFRSKFKGEDVGRIFESVVYFKDQSHPTKLFYQNGKYAHKYEDRVNDIAEYFNGTDPTPKRIEFSDGKVFHLSGYLGRGNTHHIFELADGRAIRVPISELSGGRRATLNFIEDAKILGATSVPHPEVFYDEFSKTGEYVIVEKVNTKPKHTLGNFLSGKWKSDKSTSSFMAKQILGFLESLNDVENIPDMHLDNIHWDGTKWVLLDYSWVTEDSVKLRELASQKSAGVKLYEEMLKLGYGSTLDEYFDLAEDRRLDQIQAAGLKAYKNGRHQVIPLFEDGKFDAHYNERMATLINDFKKGNTYPVELQFSDGRKVRVTEILGSGISTAVFRTESGTAIRLPSSSNFHLDRIKQYSKIYNELDPAVSMPSIVEVSDKNEFVVVSAIKEYVPKTTLTDFLSSPLYTEGGRLSRDMFQGFLDFSRPLEKYSNIPGLDPDSIIWDGSKWVMTNVGFFQGAEIFERKPHEGSVLSEQIFNKIENKGGLSPEWKYFLATLPDAQRKTLAAHFVDIDAELGISQKPVTTIFDNGKLTSNYNPKITNLIEKMKLDDAEPMTLSFSNGQKIVVKGFIGSGVTSAIFLTEDNKAIRIPRHDSFIDFPKAYLETDLDLQRTNIDRPKVYHDLSSSKGEFVIMEYIPEAKDAESLSDFYRNPASLKTADGKKKMDALVEFSKQFNDVFYISDLKPDNVVWTGEKWILLDYGLPDAPFVERVPGTNSAFFRHLMTISNSPIDDLDSVDEFWKQVPQEYFDQFALHFRDFRKASKVIRNIELPKADADEKLLKALNCLI